MCVAGYFPWTFVQSLSKASQMKNIFRWLSNDALPAYVASYHKINLWARSLDDGRLAIALINTSFDPAESVTLMINTSSGSLEHYDDQCESRQIQCSSVDGPYRQFVLPTIELWRMRLVIC